MVVSRNSKKKVYHEEFCPYAKRIAGKYRKHLTKEQARSKGYKPCEFCGKTHGLYYRMQKFPDQYPAELKKMRISFDKEWSAICFNTGSAFWKIMWYQEATGFRLYHLNKEYYSPQVSDKCLAKRKFHRQKDVKPSGDVRYLIKYIAKHDQAKQIMYDDWRKLPKQTKTQKKYYKQAKKKAKRKAINRVNDIFKQLERERRIKNG